MTDEQSRVIASMHCAESGCDWRRQVSYCLCECPKCRDANETERVWIYEELASDALDAKLEARREWNEIPEAELNKGGEL